MSLDGFRKIVRGNNIYHRVQILNLKVTPARPIAPDGSVKLTYYQPDGTVHPDVSAVTMTPVVGVVGEYEYDFQSAVDDPLGVWSRVVTIVHLGRTNLTPRENKFELVNA